MSRITSFFIALITFAGSSAANLMVKGHVVDLQGNPEAYATIRIFAEGDTVKAEALGVVDEEGNFSQSLSKPGTYILNITSVGKVPFSHAFKLAASGYDFGTITMADNASELGEVVVEVRKPLVKKEIDRIGYDVQADDDSKTANLSDMLRKVPMVTVDADGTIKVKGSSNFKIYKNGKPNKSFTSNAKDIFKALPASLIKKIEVITDPGAKEDAEGTGAILNIVTNDDSEFAGIMGMLSTQAGTNKSPGANIWLTGNVGKVNLSVNGGYFHIDRKMAHNDVYKEQVYTDSGNRLISKSSPEGWGDIGFWGFDGSYELDSLNLFTAEFNGFAQNINGEGMTSSIQTSPDGTPLFSYDTRLAGKPYGRYISFNGGINYQRMTRRKGETITLLYQIANSRNKSDQESTYDNLFNFPAPYQAMIALSDQKFLEQTAQADWARPIFKNGNMSVGGKFIYRNNHATGSNEYISEQTAFRATNFIHTTSISALYADYRHTFGPLSARAGLRYEYSHMKAKFKDGSEPDFSSNLNDWVPNLSVMWNVNDANSLKLSYTTRISRPDISQLDPNITTTPTSQSSGNPDLESVYNQSIALNYSLLKQNFNINFDVSYAFSNNNVTSFTYLRPGSDDYLITSYDNIGRNRQVYFSLFSQWSVTKKTSLMLNASTNWSRILIPEISNSHWGYSVFFRVSQNLPWELKLEGAIYHGSGDLESVYAYSDNRKFPMYYGFSLQRSFLKDKALTVQLHAQNPGRKYSSWRTKTDRGPFTGISETKVSQGNTYSVSISYRFGSVKTQVKKTSVSVNNDDGGAASAKKATTGSSLSM